MRPICRLALGRSRAARTTSGTPAAVVGLASPARAVWTGGYQSCALMTDGHAFCWGSNSLGQLGNGSSTMAGVAPAPTLLRNFPLNRSVRPSSIQHERRRCLPLRRTPLRDHHDARVVILGERVALHAAQLGPVSELTDDRRQDVRVRRDDDDRSSGALPSSARRSAVLSAGLTSTGTPLRSERGASVSCVRLNCVA